VTKRIVENILVSNFEIVFGCSCFSMLERFSNIYNTHPTRGCSLWDNRQHF